MNMNKTTLEDVIEKGSAANSLDLSSVGAFDEYKNINISKNQLNSLQFSVEKLQQKEIKELQKFGIQKCFVDSYII